MRFRLAIFDIDGTLVDSFGWFCSVLNEVAERHDFRKIETAADIERMRGLDTRGILRDLEVPIWKVPAIARDMRAMKLNAGLGLFDGAAAMLEVLHRRDTTLAIVSSDNEDSIRRALGETARFISHYRCGASLFGKAGKLREVIRATEIPASEAIYIGDETRDAAAARKAGLRFAAVNWGYASPAVLAACAPDAVLDRISDIETLFG
ncbi:HAD hydrolase-like protein [Flaviflagellibacter deserti]|uniref:HAD hydrolase-like protein n=1 Tax=Flaviflagellibacter deserti TaxID=2267266 RepID=A0ABV9Z6D4_9HYPH